MTGERPERSAQTRARGVTSADLDRGTYRAQRRLDALKLMPVLGVVAFLLPLMAAGAMPAGGTAQVGLYLFAAWAGLIALTGWLSRQAVRDRAGGRTQQAASAQAPDAEGRR